MSKRVLVVDDDNGVRTLLSALLRRAGYEFEMAIDGEEGISRLRRSSYDAVILDLMMPVTNGFEVLQFLKSDRPAMLPRVIVATAASHLTLRDFDTSRIHALIRKPFDIDRIMEAVAACCGHGESLEESPLRSPSPESLDA